MKIRVGIIGGGLVGLATARALLALCGEAVQVVLLEKETAVGRHQSTHNSGVLHAGLYYAPGSYKARLAVAGVRRMIAFCREHAIPFEVCGKLVVAAEPAELPRLQRLHERGQQNGLQGLRWLRPAEARELEPHVQCAAAVHVPEEGIVDYRAVCSALADGLVSAGATIRTGCAVTGIRPAAGGPVAGPATGRGWVLTGDWGDETVDLLVSCAGLHADRIARLAGVAVSCSIIPFRGEYYTLRPEREQLVRHLIYPVPDPAFPFLGVHFTRLIGGGVEAGPNAVLALAREGYSWRVRNGRDAWEAVSYPGLWRFLARYPRVSAREVARSLSARRFAAALQRLVPAVDAADLVPAHAGVRAQALTPAGDLVQDFMFADAPGAVHVLNAPSPAATASLALGEEIARRLLRNAGLDNVVPDNAGSRRAVG
jgi:(S)-2-hydroxyglutarate dehydrogenase